MEEKLNIVIMNLNLKYWKNWIILFLRPAIKVKNKQ